jgi:phospholipase C
MLRKYAAVLFGLFFLFLSPHRTFADGNISHIKHIIIVMQENHSFDNYFGALAYAPRSPYHNAKGSCSSTDHQCVDGLTCTADATGNLTCSNSNPDDNGTVLKAFHEPSRCIGPDLDHSWFATHREANFTPLALN